MSFTLIIGPVRAADDLKECVVLHRLIKVHRLKNRSIKSGQQLCGDNNELKRAVRITKIIKNFTFLITVTAVFLIAVFFVIIRIHDNGGSIFSEELIKDGLIHQAAFTVIYNYLTFIAVRLDLFLEVFGNMLAHLTNTGRVIHDGFHIDSAGQFILFVS